MTFRIDAREKTRRHPHKHSAQCTVHSVVALHAKERARKVVLASRYCKYGRVVLDSLRRWLMGVANDRLPRGHAPGSPLMVVFFRYFRMPCNRSYQHSRKCCGIWRCYHHLLDQTAPLNSFAPMPGESIERRANQCQHRVRFRVVGA